jgi:acetyl esterase/lipase
VPRRFCKSTTDLVFAEIGGHELLLDISVPNDIDGPPLVMWIHGGGWREGSHKANRIPWIAEYGYATASISYRLTDRAVFPAQIHDCKGAVRWLRANAVEFGYDATRIAAAGSSAGAHLAMLLGTSAGVKALEGEVGGNLDQSSTVSAVVQYFGPSDFVLRAETQPSSATSPERGSFKLLNGDATGHIDMNLARMASPVFYVEKDSCPMLSFHGLADTVVLPDQALRIADAFRRNGLAHELRMIPGAGHGDQVFFEGENRAAVVRFLKQYL